MINNDAIDANGSLNQELKRKNTEIERLREDKDKSDTKLKTLGIDTTESQIYLSPDDFARDWNTDSFYLVGSDTFCPKSTGGNIYQRMYYKYDVPLVASSFNIKFQMVDRDEETYAQQVVVGVKHDGAVLYEYHIPTRSSDGQIINFWVASDTGKLIPGSEGIQFSPPIKEGSTIDLKLNSKLSHGQVIDQILSWDYFSSLEEYGYQRKSESRRTMVYDPRPETTRGEILIGSYLGGCIRIIEWRVN